jgi:ABC-type transport system involved in multi-copper enzyme maturation permease subunit
MKTGQNRRGQEIVFFFVFLVICLTGLVIVFIPIFKSSLINPAKDSLFIALVLLMVLIVMVTVRKINQK